MDILYKDVRGIRMLSKGVNSVGYSQSSRFNRKKGPSSLLNDDLIISHIWITTWVGGMYDPIECVYTYFLII